MVSAIVYSSKTGSCKRYAEMLSAALHVPAMTIEKAPVRNDGEVIYVGWAMAGKVVGYEKTAKKMNVTALVQVGMSPVTEKLLGEVREKNAVPDGVQVFAKQGAFDMKKLPIPYRIIMKAINKKIATGLSKKAERTAEEEATYQMALNGAGQPAAWDVSDILAWAKKDWLDGSKSML